MKLLSNINKAETERLKEDFEILARSVKCSSAAHTFAAAQGVTVVWNSPLNCYRNSIASKAVVTHNPGSLPTPGERFLDQVERLDCRELVLAKDSEKAAFVQDWKYTRQGQRERYVFTRIYRNKAREVAEIVVDNSSSEVKARRYRTGF